MRGIVWVVLLFTVAVVAASTLGSNDGLVSLFWGNWRTDLSLNLFVMLVLGSCALFMLAVQAINSLVSLPKRADGWRALRRERAAQAALREALAEYFGARYGRAGKAAQRALDLQTTASELASDTQFRLLAQLLMAGSQHRLQDRVRRDATLQSALPQVALLGQTASLANAPSAAQSSTSLAAQVVTPIKVSSARNDTAEEALRLLAAEWALDDRDAPRALELLALLSPGAARRTQALRLKLQAARMARQPLEALHTARLLTNHQAFSPVVAQGLLRALVGEALETAHDPAQLQRLWTQFDASDRRDLHVVVQVAGRAVHLGEFESARNWLRPFWDQLAQLPREDRELLALALVRARTGIGADWLPRLESAVQAFGHESAVVAAVGLVFAERQLWGKARTLLEQAASAPGLHTPTRRAAWRQLAELAIREGDTAREAQCHKAAAALD
jgi:HemY protein